MARLIILSCSRLKRKQSAALPAIQRYDGPAFRLLRRYFQRTGEQLETFILSAEFGLIRHDQLIPDYERRMTLQRACELSTQVTRQAEQLLQSPLRPRKKSHLFINLGQTYLKAFDLTSQFITANYNLKLASGSSGRRLSEMYEWLYGPKVLAKQMLQCRPMIGVTRLRGIEIKLAPEKILNIARKAMIEAGERSSAYQSWWVQVDGCCVSPKWLVSLLTGLPVSAFHSDEARRVLSELGVEVRRR